MAVPIFTGNVLAVLWDFDQTLIPGYQQQPLFEAYGVDPKAFWTEVGGLVDFYEEQNLRISPGTAYLNHMLTYVKEGKFAGLTNARLRELGMALQFYPGMPEFMADVASSIEGKEEFKRHDVRVEHYVVSTGLRQMILGSAVAPQLRDVWACEFIEHPAGSGFLEPTSASDPAPPGEISQVGYFLDDTTKTRAVWEINKGVNVEPKKIGVNDFIAPEDRRVPLRNMIYIADGPSDIPILSILNQYGGRTLGVYNPDQDKHFSTVKALRDQGRVQEVVEADYRAGTTAQRWIHASLEEMAELVVRDREAALSDKVRAPGGHVT